jgi:hypothetical protein
MLALVRDVLPCGFRHDFSDASEPLTPAPPDLAIQPAGSDSPLKICCDTAVMTSAEMCHRRGAPRGRSQTGAEDRKVWALCLAPPLKGGLWGIEACKPSNSQISVEANRQVPVFL